MPFANKFIHTFALPKPGGTIGGFHVVSIDVGHEGFGSGVYRYPVRMVLQGKGGQQGVLSTLRSFLSSRKTTFSGYGNPYQLWFGKMSAVTLTPGVYEVTANGWGARVDLEHELRRFMSYLADQDIAPSVQPADDVYTEYFTQYQIQVRKKQTLG